MFHNLEEGYHVKRIHSKRDFFQNPMMHLQPGIPGSSGSLDTGLDANTPHSHLPGSMQKSAAGTTNVEQPHPLLWTTPDPFTTCQELGHTATVGCHVLRSRPGSMAGVELPHTLIKSLFAALTYHLSALATTDQTSFG
jgi:hypothetical protein